MRPPVVAINFLGLFWEKKVKNIRCLAVLAVLAMMVGCEKQAEVKPSASPTSQVALTAPKPQPNSVLVSRETPVNAAPLGIEIGYANLAGVREKLGGSTKLEETGTNRYSGGPMLESNGDGLGVDGLTSLLLIFDKNNVLAGVVMTLPKNPKGIAEQLAEKYRMVDNKIDTFMNKGYARMEKGDSVVEINAPHMAFTMDIRYLSKQFLADYQRESAEEVARKKQDQVNKL